MVVYVRPIVDVFEVMVFPWPATRLQRQPSQGRRPHNPGDWSVESILEAELSQGGRTHNSGDTLIDDMS